MKLVVSLLNLGNMRDFFINLGHAFFLRVLICAEGPCSDTPFRLFRRGHVSKVDLLSFAKVRSPVSNSDLILSFCLNFLPFSNLVLFS